MIRFSQNDARWKNEKLGTGAYTIGTAGCLVCGLATACQKFGYGETPATINQKFIAVGGFSGSEIGLWSLANAVPGMVYVDRIKCYDPVPAPIELIDRYMSEDKVVVVLVDYDPVKTGVQNHWVVLETKAGDDYIILDPVPIVENGGPVSLMARFGKGKNHVSEAIYEVCVFTSESPAQESPNPLPEGGQSQTSPDLPKAGEVWKPKGDYVNDRLQPSTSAADVGDTTGPVTLSADAVKKNGEIWLPHQVTVTVWSAGWLMKKVSPATQEESQ
jgi:hypothetical protein